MSISCVSICVVWAKYRWNHVNNIVEEYFIRSKDNFLQKFDQKIIYDNNEKKKYS